MGGGKESLSLKQKSNREDLDYELEADAVTKDGKELYHKVVVDGETKSSYLAPNALHRSQDVREIKDEKAKLSKSASRRHQRN